MTTQRAVESCSKVAVYGTLRRGCGNWKYLLDRDPAMETTLTNFKMYSLGGFPAVVRSDQGSDRITVEVYDITGEDLRRLDQLEGFNEGYPEQSMYVRESVIINDETVYIYVWGPRHSLQTERVIESGDWINRREGVT